MSDASRVAELTVDNQAVCAYPMNSTEAGRSTRLNTTTSAIDPSIPRSNEEGWSINTGRLGADGSAQHTSGALGFL